MSLKNRRREVIEREEEGRKGYIRIQLEFTNYSHLPLVASLFLFLFLVLSAPLGGRLNLVTGPECGQIYSPGNRNVRCFREIYKNVSTFQV